MDGLGSAIGISLFFAGIAALIVWQPWLIIAFSLLGIVVFIGSNIFAEPEDCECRYGE